MLAPTCVDLHDPAARPYFLWWCDATVKDLHARLRDPEDEVRAYWMGALLREANTRDVWLFVTPAEVRALWPRLLRYLGRSRAMWALVAGVARAGVAARGGARCEVTLTASE